MSKQYQTQKRKWYVYGYYDALEEIREEIESQLEEIREMRAKSDRKEGGFTHKEG